MNPKRLLQYFFFYFHFVTSRILFALSIRLIALCCRHGVKFFYFTDRLYEVNLFSPAVCSISAFICKNKEKISSIEKITFKNWETFLFLFVLLNRFTSIRWNEVWIAKQCKVWRTKVCLSQLNYHSETRPWEKKKIKKLTILSIATVPMHTSGSLKYEHTWGRVRRWK